jgi:hypothetical protein
MKQVTYEIVNCFGDPIGIVFHSPEGAVKEARWRDKHHPAHEPHLVQQVTRKPYKP